ncbi:hypothetical protein N836_31405 [Leptolyngbya sp. Heron Island J]|uniref:hypothetical protein n=1 Tax=Leptolyngbya sp. Heron Island J TaxID=1385935 RepID=UPI0003B95B7C|nr:hypothetical protein [Leptolyngbya sp. Heron Island J]ESA38449.1 hypothetical protein N836_31405 [Leptolyngbya sp. Heron Island J]
MLENPAVLEALIGTVGLVSVAATAIFSRDSVKDKLKQLDTLADQVESRIEKRFSQLESTLGYIKSRVDGLEKILEDDIISPAEVQTMRDEILSIKEKFGDVFSGGQA